jgi:crossover junction endodeoxyribonuclease RuvC
MQKIIGIDPGTGTIGFGIIISGAGGRNARIVTAGTITTKAFSPLNTRLETIFNELTEILKEHKPSAMSIEPLFFAQNTTTAMAVAHARGVIMLAAQLQGIEIFEYTPLQIKQSLTGYGRATKTQMKDMVATTLKLKKRITQDDAVDGLAAAICHASSF